MRAQVLITAMLWFFLLPKEATAFVHQCQLSERFVKGYEADERSNRVLADFILDSEDKAHQRHKLDERHSLHCFPLNLATEPASEAIACNLQRHAETGEGTADFSLSNTIVDAQARFFSLTATLVVNAEKDLFRELSVDCKG